jgi:hypothetical protein
VNVCSKRSEASVSRAGRGKGKSGREEVRSLPPPQLALLRTTKLPTTGASRRGYFPPIRRLPAFTDGALSLFRPKFSDEEREGERATGTLEGLVSSPVAVNK